MFVWVNVYCLQSRIIAYDIQRLPMLMNEATYASESEDSPSPQGHCRGELAVLLNWMSELKLLVGTEHG